MSSGTAQRKDAATMVSYADISGGAVKNYGIERVTVAPWDDRDGRGEWLVVSRQTYPIAGMGDHFGRTASLEGTSSTRAGARSMAAAVSRKVWPAARRVDVVRRDSVQVQACEVVTTGELRDSHGD